MKTTLACLALVFPAISASAQSEADLAHIQAWVEQVRSIDSLAASFKQERTIMQLRNPLKSTTGNLWYKKPNKFRWELGSPAKTIAVHSGSELTVCNVDDKEATVTNTSSAEKAAEVAAYFDLVFPQSWAEFSGNFAIESVDVKADGSFESKLKPVSPEKLRGLKAMTIQVGADKQLQGFELVLGDGAKVRTEFTKFVKNVYLPTTQFQVALDGYAVKRK